MNKFLLLVFLITVADGLRQPVKHPLARRRDDGGILCEENPTHLLCVINELTGHLPVETPTAIVSCDEFFLSGVHCCEAFCENSIGLGTGVCDSQLFPDPDLPGTGACFCDYVPLVDNTPDNCPVLTIPEDAPEHADFQQMIQDECVPACAKNPNGCTAATFVTAGPLGTVCMCYCAQPPPA